MSVSYGVKSYYVNCFTLSLILKNYVQYFILIAVLKFPSCTILYRVIWSYSHIHITLYPTLVEALEILGYLEGDWSTKSGSSG